MCRSIKQLRLPDTTPSHAEMEAAALQYVRKISGYRAPSRANREAFDLAVAEITRVTHELLEAIADPRATAGHTTANAETASPQ